jgi:hypothetical protein
MIQIIEGFGVGAGKSFFCVTLLIEHWISGGTAYVADTMEVLWAELKQHVAEVRGYVLQDSQYVSLPEEAILRVHEHTPPGTEDCPVLIVIDECHGKLNARDWNDKSKRDLFDWCTQSRHDDNDLIFISQSAANIDKQLRRIATYNWRIRNSERMGENNVLRTALKVWKWISFGLHGGPQFIVSQLDQDGRTLLGKKIFLPQDKRIFKVYRSKSMRGKRKRSGNAVARVKIERAKPMLKKGYMKYAFMIVLVMVGLGVWKLATADWHPKSSAAKAVGTTVTQATTKTEINSKATYETKGEPWRARGKGWMKTDAGYYRVGRMSPSGMVEAIADGVVRIKKPDGQLLFIVGQDVTVPAGTPIPAQTPWNKEIVYAKDGTAAEWATPTPIPSAFTVDGRLRSMRAESPFTAPAK